MTSCSKFSSSLIEVALVAVLKFDPADNISSDIRSKFSVRVQNESSQGFGGFVYVTMMPCGSNNTDI